jgi:hypothetical protein
MFKKLALTPAVNLIQLLSFVTGDGENKLGHFSLASKQVQYLLVRSETIYR